MRKIEISEIASVFENYGKNELPLILIRNGQPVAALFSVEDVDMETLSISINPKFIKIVEESRRSQKEEGRIFLEDIDVSLER